MNWVTTFIVPLMVAFLGTGVYTTSARFDGLKAHALIITGWVIWCLAVCYVLWGAALYLWMTAATMLDIERVKQYNEKLPPRPEPEPEPEPIPQFAYETTSAYRTRSLGLEPAKLRKVATMLVGGCPFSEDYLVNKTGVLEARECRSFKDNCLRLGLAEWKGKSKTQGVKMTSRGEATFQVIADGGLRRVGTPPPKPRESAATANLPL